MLDLWGWEHFGEGVGNHVVGGAENKVDLAIVNYPADKVKAHVNMFGVHVILVVLCECNSRLII